MKVSFGLGGTGVLALPWWIRTWYVRLARFLGVRIFDTAKYYGPSESVFGNSGLKNATVITKWGMGHASSDYERWSSLFPEERCLESIQESRRVIGKTRNFGFLLHLPIEEYVEKHIEALKVAKKIQGIQFIGYSADAEKHILSDNSWCDWIVIHYSLAPKLKGFSGIVAVHGAFKSKLSFFQLNEITRDLSSASEVVFLSGTSNPLRLLQGIEVVSRLAKQ